MTMIINNVPPLELAFEERDQLPTQAVSDLAATTDSAEINRLLVAAIVNHRFCQLLLGNPVVALAAGYRGQPFKLTSAARSRILAIYATSLQDFARQLATEIPQEPRLLHRRRLAVPEIATQSTENYG